MEKYNLSSKNLRIYFYFILLGIPLVFFSAWALAFVEFFIPIFGVATLVAIGAFGVANGLIVQFLARIGRCNSKLHLFIISAFTSLVGLYHFWNILLYFHAAEILKYSIFEKFRYSVFAFLWLSPSKILGVVPEMPGFTIGSSFDVTGNLLTAYYIVQALLMLLATTVAALIYREDQISCALCGSILKAGAPEQRNFQFTSNLSLEEDIRRALTSEIVESESTSYVYTKKYSCDRCKVTEAIEVDSSSTDGEKLVFTKIATYRPFDATELSQQPSIAKSRNIASFVTWISLGIGLWAIFYNLAPEFLPG
jgi:hypothetical protein